MNFDPQEHDYVEHHTYSGPGCAQCGKWVGYHRSALLPKEMTAEEFKKQYPGIAVKER